MMKQYGTNKGFTLIELLVVISIIGLLSSVVLASLNSARGKAKDAAIKENLHQLSTVMALDYDQYGSYCSLHRGWITATAGNCDTVFPDNGDVYMPQIRAICNTIYANAGENNWGSPGQYKIHAAIDGTHSCLNSYSIMVFLNDGKWYCMGSSGASGEYVSYGDPPNSNPGCYGNP